VESTKSPEFSLERPFNSVGEVLRSLFRTPKEFYLNFNPSGPLREPTIFVLLVSAVTGVLGIGAALIRGYLSGADGSSWIVGVVSLNLGFIIFSPLVVTAVSVLYLLSIKTLVEKEADLRGVYRMFAYAWGPMILFWVPVIQAFAFAYAAMVLMAVGIWGVYRASFLSSIVAALAGFLPLGVAFIWFIFTINGIILG